MRNELDSAQEAVVERALLVDGFALFFEPRVGKTRTSLEIANRRLDIDLLIVICPLSVSAVWETALQTELHHTCETMLLNFEKFNSKNTRRKLRRASDAHTTMIIVDEAHRIKNRTSKQSKGIRTLRDKSRYRLILTGTPTAQGVWDCWALFDFIDPSVFGKYADFKQKYLIMGGYMNYKVVGHKNEADFLERYHAHSARIRLTDVTERPIQIRRQLVRLNLNPYAQRLYESLEKNLIADNGRIRVTAPLVITLTLRLQQLTGGFLCSGNDVEQVDTAKLDWVLASIAQLTPCVIVCRYRHELDLLQSKLTGYSTLMIRGGEPLLSPRPTEDIVLIQTSAGIGIDLSRAATIVFYSWDYSFINYEQMRFRVLSRKQTSAHYIFLMIEDSIDEVIYAAAVRKKKLSMAINDFYNRS